MTAKLAEYRKAIAPFLGLVIMILTTELGADSKWVTYVIALAATVGVVASPPNAQKPPADA